jgi:hypothetical protein
MDENVLTMTEDVVEASSEVAVSSGSKSNEAALIIGGIAASLYLYKELVKPAVKAVKVWTKKHKAKKQSAEYEVVDEEIIDLDETDD